MNFSHQLLLLISGAIFTTALAFADGDVSDLQRRAHEADLEAQAALEFSNRFQIMADAAADEILFLPADARASALEQADRLRNAAAGARATYHRLLDVAAEMHSALARARPRARPSDYDYRIVDAITSDILKSAIIVEVPTPQLADSPVAPAVASPVRVTIEPNVDTGVDVSPEYESGPVPQPLDDETEVNTTMTVGSTPIVFDESTNVAGEVEDSLSATENTVGSIGPVPDSNNVSAQAALDARTLANRALSFAVEMQVAAEQAQLNYQRFKDFRGRVDQKQFAELQEKFRLLTEEARLAELEYQELDSRAALLEAEINATNQ